MTENAIEIKNLKKVFQSRQGFWKRKLRETVAVEDLTLNVERGELFGLLGPNGAGKTTTVKMLSTLLLPTSGSISVFGLDAIRETNEIRKQIGFAFGGNRGLYGRLTARENLRYFAELYAMPPEKTRQRIPELLGLVGLADRGDDKVETYSSGMAQRLHLARALLHDPQLIFLDEPTVGIDPVGARELRQTVKTLIEHGKTILLTTHYMAEADELCDHIAIIDHGKIKAFGTPSSLKSLLKKETIVEIKAMQENFSIVKESLEKLNLAHPIEYLHENPYTIARVTALQPAAVIELFTPLLSSRVIESLEVRNQTMEDVYIAIIQGEAG